MEKNLWQKESFPLLAACARLIGFSHKFFRQIGVRPICLLLHHRHQHLWLLEPTLCCEKGTPASNQVRTIVWLSRAPRTRALIHLRVHTHTQTHHGRMASLYQAITVTDLCLLLLCHLGCHIAWLPQQLLHDVKRKKKKKRQVKTRTNPEKRLLNFPRDRIDWKTRHGLIHIWRANMSVTTWPAAVKCLWQDYGTPALGCHNKDLHSDLLRY